MYTIYAGIEKEKIKEIVSKLRTSFPGLKFSFRRSTGTENFEVLLNSEASKASEKCVVLLIESLLNFQFV